MEQKEYDRMVTQQNIGRVVSQSIKMLKYVYMAALVLMIVLVARDELSGLGNWEIILEQIIVTLEIVGIVVYLGVKVSIRLFKNVSGNVLGTDAYHIVNFWSILEVNIQELLVYNGVIGVMLMRYK